MLCLRAMFSICPPLKSKVAASCLASSSVSSGIICCHIFWRTAASGLSNFILYRKRRSKAESKFSSRFVVTIGEYAFFHCDSLKHVYNYSPEPQSLSVIFNRKDITIHVPAASAEKYHNAQHWKDMVIVGDL